MSRYIDAEWLKELYKPYKSYNGKELAVPIGAILANIDDAPSIDIVRCKECKYEKRCTTNVHFLADNGLDVIPVHFCSYGEREGE